ncbi:MAG: tetratricopeptide repeat protein [Pseudomonadota bacterium]
MTWTADTPRLRPVQAALLKGCLFAFLSLSFPTLPSAEAADAVAPETTPTATESKLDSYSTSLYADGRAAFRRGDHSAAAALFEKASLAGYPDPVVFYNLGAARFRLGEYEAAEAAFATAAAYERLAPLAYYNLGLIARRQQDYRNADGWFRQAGTHPQASAKLARLSRQAIASLPEVHRQRPTLELDEPARLRDFLRFSFNAGYGSDSNAYRAPSASYIDLALPGAPEVVPVVQSGSFIPLDADVEFRWAPHEKGHFSLRYDFDGKVFTAKELQNANAFRNRIAFGGRVHIPRENGYQYFRSFFAITSLDENYYDRTDGSDVLVGATNIADRFKRTKFGPHVYYHRERGRLGYGLSAEAFINKFNNDFDTDEDLDYLDLTHEQYQLGAHLSFDVLKRTELRFSADAFRRDYTRRLAKNADGVRFNTNDNLQFDFYEGGVKLVQELGRQLDVSLGYRYAMRKDNFEGYDDYDRHSGLAELAFRARRFSAEAGVVYRSYDFPNGFAFDQAAAGEKTLERLFGYLEARYRIRQRYHIMVSAELDAVDSTDPRAAYDRNQFAVGMSWNL